MTASQLKQALRRFRPHLQPVKTFRGDPTRPAYTLYSLWQYPTYLAVLNELDELLDQWPHNQQRTVALLAAQQAFSDNGATHWAVGQVEEENQTNVHALMLHERQRARCYDSAADTRHEENLVLAKAALAESQRCKQGPPTGRAPRRAPVRQPKALVFAPARPRPTNRPAARPRYTVGQLLRDPVAYQALLNELDALLEHWPYKSNRIFYLLTVREALAQRGGPPTDESCLLHPGQPDHRAPRLQRALSRAADPQRAARHQQSEHEARASLASRQQYRKYFP
ncbi:MAG: hypothetical protein ACRYFX_16965 [Janthinobacterium lividum]